MIEFIDQAINVSARFLPANHNKLSVRGIVLLQETNQKRCKYPLAV